MVVVAVCWNVENGLDDVANENDEADVAGVDLFSVFDVFKNERASDDWDMDCAVVLGAGSVGPEAKDHTGLGLEGVPFRSGSGQTSPISS